MDKDGETGKYQSVCFLSSKKNPCYELRVASYGLLIGNNLFIPRNAQPATRSLPLYSKHKAIQTTADS